jgi:hypothetical protein
MGATTWSYFTPFHQDVGNALQAVREKVFADGAYQTPNGDFNKAQHDRNLDYLKGLYEAMEPGCSARAFPGYFIATPCGRAGPVANAVLKSTSKRRSRASRFLKTLIT